jgi:signal transduction histidine kinase
LTIKDNGNGFTPDNCLGPNNGHFGLLGMSERAKRLGGNILINSAPGMGTTIRMEIPILETAVIKPANNETHTHEETGYEEDIPDTDSCC